MLICLLCGTAPTASHGRDTHLMCRCRALSMVQDQRYPIWYFGLREDSVMLRDGLLTWAAGLEPIREPWDSPEEVLRDVADLVTCVRVMRV